MSDNEMFDVSPEPTVSVPQLPSEGSFTPPRTHPYAQYMRQKKSKSWYKNPVYIIIVTVVVMGVLYFAYTTWAESNRRKEQQLLLMQQKQHELAERERVARMQAQQMAAYQQQLNAQRQQLGAVDPNNPYANYLKSTLNNPYAVQSQSLPEPGMYNPSMQPQGAVPPQQMQLPGMGLKTSKHDQAQMGMGMPGGDNDMLIQQRLGEYQGTGPGGGQAPLMQGASPMQGGPQGADSISGGMGTMNAGGSRLASLFGPIPN